MKSLRVKIVLAIALLIGFTCGTVYSQDFTIWNNTYWKMKQTAKGYYFEDETALTSSAKARGTEQVWGIMTANDIGDSISLAVYEGGAGEACELIDTFTIVKRAGGPEEFYATFEMDVADVIYATGLFSFTAKLKNEIFQNGKMTTLGAYALEQDFDVPNDLAVVGINMSGTTVSIEKVKCTLP
jgi:hypothetical protein